MGTRVTEGGWWDRQQRAAGSSAPACSPVWRKMTPEEYAAQYRTFGPHRATIECEVISEAASAAVSVCLLGFVDTANARLTGATPVGGASELKR